MCQRRMLEYTGGYDASSRTMSSLRFPYLQTKRPLFKISDQKMGADRRLKDNYVQNFAPAGFQKL